MRRHKRVSTTTVYISGTFGLANVVIRTRYNGFPFVSHHLFTLDNGIAVIS